MEKNTFQEIKKKIHNINLRNQSIKDLLSCYKEKSKFNNEKEAVFELENEKRLLIQLVHKDREALNAKDSNWLKVLEENQASRYNIYKKNH